MTDILIGRQQILDSNLDTYAYEILFRGSDLNLNIEDEAASATNQVITDTILEIGLNEIAGPHKAFINFTAQNLLANTPFLLPKDRIVIEVVESVTVDARIISRLKELSQGGYTLALDDFVLTDEWRPLLEFADIVKLDVLANGQQDTYQLIQQLKAYNLTLLAEKVETHEEYIALKSWGCELFQGYFFSKPIIVQGKRLGINQASAIQLLSRINQPNVSFIEISEIISQDVGLSFKLLHYMNSAFFSLPTKIDSIQQATILLGQNELRRWINILTMASLSEKSKALFQLALIRAKMSELLASHLGEDTERYFLIGMFSCLDSVLDLPIDQVLAQLPLSKDIAEPILYHTGKAGEVLQYALNYERWNLSSNTFYDISPKNISDIYIKSITWSQRVLASLD